MKKELVSFGAAMVVASGFAAGFGLYEMSAKAMGMGGHVIGKAADASANYYNPATISDFTGTVVTVGMSVLHPLLDTAVDGKNTHKMNPGYFVAPNAFITQELPWGFTAGLGFYADYGLGSHYHGSWPLGYDSQRSKFEGYTVNPNLSYKITDKWSIAGGVRLTHASFEQHRVIPTDLSALGLGVRRARMKLDVDNDVDVGYVLGTKYDVTDTFSVGAVWRSNVRLDLEGDSKMSGVPGSVTLPNGTKVAIGDKYSGDISDKLDLPMSATVGYNWDILEDLHMGASLTWTEWSSVDTLEFTLPAGRQVMDLGWHDAYRTGFGFSYDITENWAFSVGYVYDWDPTRDKRPATMLPAGDRHIICFGPVWSYGAWELSASYELVILESKTLYVKTQDGTGTHRFETDNCFTHVVCLSATYRF